MDVYGNYRGDYTPWDKGTYSRRDEYFIAANPEVVFASARFLGPSTRRFSGQLQTGLIFLKKFSENKRVYIYNLYINLYNI